MIYMETVMWMAKAQVWTGWKRGDMHDVHTFP